jgi:hypothetical protein
MRDPLSPIADFYPSNIKLDINNQPYAWMGVNLLPFIDADRIQKVVKTIIDSNKLNEKEKKLNKRGNNILISRDLEIFKKFEGELTIHSEINTFNKFLKEDGVIKGIHPGDVDKDKSQSFIFNKKINNKKHCSKILKGVIPHKKCIIEDNLDNYSKNKFKGKDAIDMVKEVLGTRYDNLEGDFIAETFDEHFANNNRAIEYDPQKRFLLMKKRYQEKENKTQKNNNKIIDNINTKKEDFRNNINKTKNNNPKNDNNINTPVIHLNEDDEEKDENNIPKEDKKTKKKVENNKNENNVNKKVKKFDSLLDTMAKMKTALNMKKKK